MRHFWKRWLEVGVPGLVVACTAWHAPEPPPDFPIPPPPPETHADVDGTRPSPVPTLEPSQGGTPAEGPAPSIDTAEPRVFIELETPYKLGERAQPKTKEEYRQDLFDLRRWNDGGTGDLVAEMPGPEGHPDPRVVIDVEQVRGPHRKIDLQRLLRRNHWIQIVRCYRLGYHEDAELRGWTKARFTVTSEGAVRSARLIHSELALRAVARCMTEKLTKLRLSRAAARSRVLVSMKVGPGDDPLPPPEDLLVAGAGKLPIDAMRRGLEAGLPAIEACHEAALAYAPGLWGRIAIRFHVTARGRLDEAFQIGSRFPDARVSQCVLREARKLRFDRPEGGELRFVVALRLWTDRSQFPLHESPPR